MHTGLRIRQQISKLIFLHIFERWQMLKGSSENKLAFLAKNHKDYTVAAVCIYYCTHAVHLSISRTVMDRTANQCYRGCVVAITMASQFWMSVKRVCSARCEGNCNGCSE